MKAAGKSSLSSASPSTAMSEAGAQVLAETAIKLSLRLRALKEEYARQMETMARSKCVEGVSSKSTEMIETQLQESNQADGDALVDLMRLHKLCEQKTVNELSQIDDTIVALAQRKEEIADVIQVNEREWSSVIERKRNELAHLTEKTKEMQDEFDTMAAELRGPTELAML